MIKGKFLTPSDPAVQECFELRRKVFIDEQGISASEEYDEWDKYAVFAAVYDEENKIVATGRIIFDGDVYKIGRIACLKEHRGKHYGDFVVRMMVDRCFAHGAGEVHLGAQSTVVPFYEKIGFKICGDEYVEANIPHYPMIIKAADFTSPCGGCKGCK